MQIHNTAPENIYKGLDGVYVDTTAICDIDGVNSKIIYCGKNLADLVRDFDFYEVVHLLIEGRLPNKTEHFALVARTQERQAAALPSLKYLAACPRTAHPVDLLRLLVLQLGAEQSSFRSPTYELAREQILDLIAAVPVFVAAICRHKAGQDWEEIDFSQRPEETFLRICLGKKAEAGDLAFFNAARVLYAEHNFNAGTFAARTVVSTGADVFGAVAAAISALKGPLHGGAIEYIMGMLENIGAAENAPAFVLDRLRKKERITGFGHRVYKKDDPRVGIIWPAAEKFLVGKNQEQWLKIVTELRATMAREKNLYANVDLPMAPAFHALGFKKEFFLPLILTGRIAGIGAHILEQIQNNRIIRPLGYYIGDRGASTAAIQ